MINITCIEINIYLYKQNINKINSLAAKCFSEFYILLRLKAALWYYRFKWVNIIIPRPCIIYCFLLVCYLGC